MIAFGARDMPIIQDQRLCECDYGAMTRFPLADVERAKPHHATRALSPRGELSPGGNAHGHVSSRRGHESVGDRILIIGTATHYGLGHWLDDVPLMRAGEHTVPLATPVVESPPWLKQGQARVTRLIATPVLFLGSDNSHPSDRILLILRRECAKTRASPKLIIARSGT